MTHWPRLAVVCCVLLASGIASADDDYRLDFRVDLGQAPQPASVSLTVSQKDGALRELGFDANDPQFVDFKSATGLTRDGDRYTWMVPDDGGTLSWSAPITHTRSSGTLDAQLGKRWALFRGEDVFAAMSSRVRKGAKSSARLHVDLPEDWSFVSALPLAEQGYSVHDTPRNFDRPRGWMIAGQIGVRIDRIAGVRTSVAAGKGQDVRRQDMLALLNWTMPDLVRLMPQFPKEILIVSAEDPFWRGGLSGPASLYLHADRPLISENGTSTLVHEMFHVGFGRSGGKLDDWIIEGLAEYYSVELLRRSGTVTASRNAKTMRGLERWAKKSKKLRGARSSGARTARAVGLFAALDTEIRRASSEYSLDDVVRELSLGDGALDLEELQTQVRQLLGKSSKLLADIS